jgi:hypothetical protein
MRKFLIINGILVKKYLKNKEFMRKFVNNCKMIWNYCDNFLIWIENIEMS